MPTRSEQVDFHQPCPTPVRAVPWPPRTSAPRAPTRCCPCTRTADRLLSSHLRRPSCLLAAADLAPLEPASRSSFACRSGGRCPSASARWHAVQPWPVTMAAAAPPGPLRVWLCRSRHHPQLANPCLPCATHGRRPHQQLPQPAIVFTFCTKEEDEVITRLPLVC